MPDVLPVDLGARVVEVRELAPVPVDDEQGVVDADREAEHGAQHGRHLLEVEPVGQRQRAEQADPDAGEGHGERHPGHHQGPEHHQQHDGGDADADGLADAADLGGEDQLLAVVHLDAGVGELLARLGHQRQVVRRDLLHAGVEAHLDQGRGAVLADEADAVAEAAQGGAVGVLLLPVLELLAGVGQPGLAVGQGGLQLGLPVDAGRQGGVVGVGALQPGDVALALADEPPQLLELAGPLLVLLASVDELPATVAQVGVAAVELGLRGEGIDRAGDVREVLPVGQRRVDGVALGGGEAVLGVQDHRAGAAGHLGDLLPQVGEHLGELAVRQLELVGERALEREHRADDGAEHEDPGEHEGERAAGCGAAEAVEQGGHGQFSWGAVGACGGRRAADSSKPAKSRSKDCRIDREEPPRDRGVVGVRVRHLAHEQARHPVEDRHAGGGQGGDVDRVGVGPEAVAQALLEGVDLAVAELPEEAAGRRRGVGRALEQARLGEDRLVEQALQHGDDRAAQRLVRGTGDEGRQRVGGDLLDGGGQHVLDPGEVVEQRPAGDPGLGGDPLGGEGVDALRGDDLDRGPAQGVARALLVGGTQPPPQEVVARLRHTCTLEQVCTAVHIEVG